MSDLAAKLTPLVTDDTRTKAMANEQCIEELCNMTCLFCGDGFGLWPFREIICHRHDILIAWRCLRERDNKINAYLLPCSQLHRNRVKRECRFVKLVLYMLAYTTWLNLWMNHRKRNWIWGWIVSFGCIEFGVQVDVYTSLYLLSVVVLYNNIPCQLHWSRLPEGPRECMY